jgi:hypothetical protein
MKSRASKRHTTHYVKPAESDADRIHRQLDEIVRTYRHGAYHYQFARALIMRLHAMRLSPATLLTSEGVDAVTAIAMALEDWDELARSTAQQPSRAWLDVLRHVGGKAPYDWRNTRDLRESTSSHFTNGIRIK